MASTWQVPLLLAGLALAAAFLAYTFFWIAKIFVGIVRGGPKLTPIAEREIQPGKTARLEYPSAGNGTHGLWLAIETEWKGSAEWKIEVSLNVSGVLTPIQAQFPLGESEAEVDINSPLLGPGITGLAARAWVTPWGGKARVTKKLCDLVASPSNGKISVDIQVEPTAQIRKLRLNLIAATIRES